MRALTAVIVCALALAASPAALGGTRIGVNDDAGKYGDGAPLFFETMASLGLSENVMTVLWDPAHPDVIADRGFLEHSLPVAHANDVEVVFDVYPAKARALADDPAAPAAFAAFVSKLAQTFPAVRRYIVMNECNQPRFLQPQFAGTHVVSAAICGQALAAAYDALKAVDPEIQVWGIGLSPRGNDNPSAPSNVSTSPVRFLAALGRWYRSSGRALPLMDGFAFHPYPNSNTDPFERGYAWPKIGAVNLDRLYQAFWDAFHDSPQPTFAESGDDPETPSIPLSLNEVGVQVDTAGIPGYTGNENIAAIDPVSQALWYADLIALAACDPHVESLTFFHLVDEPDRIGFQSGLFGLGYDRRPAADVVQSASRTCTGQERTWWHTDEVVGVRASFRGGRTLSYEASATEDARYTVGVFAVRKRAASVDEITPLLASPTAGPQAMSSSGRLTAYRPVRVTLPAGALPEGCYQVGILLRAEVSSERTSALVSRPLSVGAACARP